MTPPILLKASRSGLQLLVPHRPLKHFLHQHLWLGGQPPLFPSGNLRPRDRQPLIQSLGTSLSWWRVTSHPQLGSTPLKPHSHLRIPCFFPSALEFVPTQAAFLRSDIDLGEGVVRCHLEKRRLEIPSSQSPLRALWPLKGPWSPAPSPGWPLWGQGVASASLPWSLLLLSGRPGPGLQLGGVL